MKILVFSDIHSDDHYLEALGKIECDLVICCGDISRFGRMLYENAKKISEWGKEVLIIPGNNETVEQIEGVCKRFGFFNLHGNVFEKNGYNFVGVGGGMKWIGTPFEMSEEEFENILKKFEGYDNLIVVSHALPCNVFEDCPRSACSTALKRFILKKNPIYCFCGHMHEFEGREAQIGNTKLFVVGKKGKVIEL